jgi:Adenosine deaminase
MAWLTGHEKWNAVIRGDKACDGLFFYAVKTTGIFCRPSCKAKTPAEKNVLFFDTAHAAIAAGFRPCKLCRPDRTVYDPDADLIASAMDLLRQVYEKPVDFGAIAKQLTISRSHFIRLFKRVAGVTPNRYLTNLRIKGACSLLRQTGAGVLEIAYLSGFQSPANFYRHFKEQTGLTPLEYRLGKEDKP